MAAAAASAALALPAWLIARNEGIVGQRLPSEMVATYEQVTRPGQMQRPCRSGGSLRVCVLGDKGAEGSDAPPRMLIWGDSHAAALLPGFAAWLKASGQTAHATFKIACAPLAGINRIDMGPGHDCAGYNAEVLDWLDDHPEIDTVVLAARWRLTVDGDRPPGEAGADAVLAAAGPVAGSDAAAGAATNAALVEAGLRATLAQLSASGRRVLIVDPVPEIGFHVPRAWLAEAYPLGSLLQPEKLDLSEHQARTAATHRLLETVAAEFPQAGILRVADVLCAPQCRTEIEGTLAYRDNNHLSAAAARWLVPRIMPPAVLAAPEPET